MLIIAFTVLLFLLFFFVKKHTGAAHLAMIAGLSVYGLFGDEVAGFAAGLMGSVSVEMWGGIVYLLLILVFPLILYFRSEKGGLAGVWRVAESLVFAVLMMALMVRPLGMFFVFDGVSVVIGDFVMSVEKYVIVAGIVSAYADILLYHSPKDD